MAMQLKDFILRLIHDSALWNDFQSSPARAEEIARQHGVALKQQSVRQFIAGVDGFSSLMSLAQHHFAIHVQLQVELAGSGHVGPAPGNPHIDNFVADFGPSETMIVNALVLAR